MARDASETGDTQFTSSIVRKFCVLFQKTQTLTCCFLTMPLGHTVFMVHQTHVEATPQFRDIIPSSRLKARFQPTPQCLCLTPSWELHLEEGLSRSPNASA